MLSLWLRYGIPLATLTAVLLFFRRAQSYRPLGRVARRTLIALAVLPLILSGTVHLLRPDLMVPLLPDWVPYRVLLIRLTGVPELAGALGLVAPRTRVAASLWIAVFLIAVFPANVYVAGRTIGGLAMPGILPRTAMQIAYMLLVLIAAHRLPRSRTLRA